MPTCPPPEALAPPPSGRARTRLAEFLPVPLGEAGRILTRKNVCAAAALTLLPAGAGVVATVCCLGTAMSLAGSSAILAWLAAGLGAACAAAAVGVLLWCQRCLASRFLRDQAIRVFATRRDSLFRFEDPGALFVDVVPRARWGRSMFEAAEDIGLLRVDRARREVLFEGDLRRLRIPFEAVFDCDAEEMRLDSDDWQADLQFVTVLRVDTDNGPRELPFRLRPVDFALRRVSRRREEAEALAAAIRQAIAPRP